MIMEVMKIMMKNKLRLSLLKMMECFKMMKRRKLKKKLNKKLRVQTNQMVMIYLVMISLLRLKIVTRHKQSPNQTKKKFKESFTSMI